MKIKFLLIFFLLAPCMLFANTAVIDSMKNKLNIVEGKEKVEVLNELAQAYLTESPQQAIEYSNQALKLSEEINYLQGKAIALKVIGAGNYYLSNFDKSLEYYFKSLKNYGRY